MNLTALETHPLVITYDPRYRADFVALNVQWIEKYFVVEQHDRDQLNNPEQNILALGGEIFFILQNDQVVGTCAMVPDRKNGYELAKMAVSPKAHGRGYGDLLMTTSIEWARAKGADHVMLLSNTILEPAINLYKKHGFVTVNLGPHPDYERCNIEMIFRLKN